MQPTRKSRRKKSIDEALLAQQFHVSLFASITLSNIHTAHIIRMEFPGAANIFQLCYICVYITAKLGGNLLPSIFFIAVWNDTKNKPSRSI
jgi:hypothetical protein